MDEELVLVTKKLTTIININEITSAFYLHLSSDYKGKYEMHAPIELIYCDRGSHILYEGTKKYIINQGQAFVRKPYVQHKDDANNVPFSIYVIDFISTSEAFRNLYDNVFSLSDKTIILLKDIFEDIKSEEANSEANGQFIFDGPRRTLPLQSPIWMKQKIKNKLELFFIELLESMPAKEEQKVAPYSKSTMMVIEEIKKNLYGKFDLSQIAKQLFYSKSYLCRKFKEDTGITINQYFYEKKIVEAKNLLIKTKKSLQEISDVLNFESKQYFNYIFRKYVGLSPKHWQKLTVKDKINIL